LLFKVAIANVEDKRVVKRAVVKRVVVKRVVAILFVNVTASIFIN
jgi:hypothetical protein